VTCLQSEKLIVQESLEKENIKQNEQVNVYVLDELSGQIQSNQKIEEELKEVDKKPKRFSKTPKNMFRNLRTDFDINDSSENQLWKALNSYLNDADPQEIKQQEKKGSLSFPPAYKSILSKFD
jgi:predicted RNA-binding protein with RPS1 domain